MLIIAASPEAFNAGKAALLAANVPSVSISITVRKPLGLMASAAACTMGNSENQCLHPTVPSTAFGESLSCLGVIGT